MYVVVFFVKFSYLNINKYINMYMYTREYALIKYIRLLSRNFSLILIKSTTLPIKILVIGFAETKVCMSLCPPS